MSVVLIPVLWILGFALAASPSVPRLLAWLSPAALAVVYGVAYANQKEAASGDPQPGLVLAVGVVAVGMATVLVVVGLLWRDRKAQRR